jgi:hypothetical protein
MIKRLVDKKRAIFFLALFFSILLLTSIIAASSNVAYIYKSKNRVDKNVVGIFEDLGLNVELISERKLPNDFSNYRFLYLGDERFRNENKIPVDKYPSIISNYYFGHDWGLTDTDGISKLASNSPLKVKKGNDVLQVYTKARFNSKAISIPYYYLDDENKVPEMEKIAGTYIGNDYDFGDVISYAGVGTDLKNGKTSDKKICFFGIIESDYWTNNAEDLFKDCVDYVGMTCEKDSDCGDDDFVGDKFCKQGDVYQNYEEYDCENPGTINSDCKDEQEQRLIETCNYGCDNKECLDECTQDSDCASNEICTAQNKCLEIVCKQDSDCNDQNTYTLDTCENPGEINSYCTNQEIICKQNSDCDDQNPSTQDSCINKATPESYCENKGIDCFKDQDCDDNNQFTEDSCINKATPESYCENKGITCFNNQDCDDNDAYTFDECENSGTTQSYCSNSPINCINNNDCGFTGFTGEEFCKTGDIFKNYKTSTCNNPSTKQSFCTSILNAELILECQEQCLDGTCVEITCNSNEDCNDDNQYTYDTCTNPGTPQSNCEYDPIQCTKNSDCEDNNEYTEDICTNPGTTQSYCENKEIICFQNLDCGYNDFIGEKSCNQDNVFQDYQSFECNNPGTLESSCTQTIESQLIETCDDTCIEGECTEITCYSNDDCNDQDSSTIDTCNNPGQIDSYCSHGEISCFEHNDCGTNQYTGESYCNQDKIYKDLKIFMCNNPATIFSFCSDNTSPKLMDTCEYACAEGSCIRCDSNNDCDDQDSFTQDTCRFAGTTESYCENNIIRCSEDNDCGTLSLLDNLFCIGNKVYTNQGEMKCKKPGTTQSYCSVDFSLLLIETCQYDCLNGECIESNCQDNDLDNYDNCNPGELGDDNNPKDCNDNNPQINPGAIEICNNLDDNCDGNIDENNVCISECKDGLDNDNDGKIDALIEVQGTLNKEKSWYGELYEIRNFVNEKAEIYGYTQIPTSFDGQGFVSNDNPTAEKVCELAGYETVKSHDCHENGRYGRCIFTSPSNNVVGTWSQSNNDFEMISAVGERWLASLTCTDKIPESDCNDGIDNDNDGLIDYPEDEGCDSLRDDSEIMHDPECEDENDNE